MLKLQFVDGSRESIWLVEPRLRIGSQKGNDVVLQEPEIKDNHAEIRLKDEQLYLLNCNPEYVVSVNGRRVKKAVRIAENDLVKLGEYQLKIVSPSVELTVNKPKDKSADEDRWGLQARASWASQSFYPVDGTITIGRDNSCDITVPVSHLSRQHAQLTVAGSYMVVKDMGSTNGTFLNGERITNGRAKPGDKLRFDVIGFTVTGPRIDIDQTIVRPVEAPKTARPVSQPCAHKSPAPLADKPRSGIREAATADITNPAEAEADQRKTNVFVYTILGFFIVSAALSALLFSS